MIRMQQDLSESQARARRLAESPDVLAGLLPHPADESWRKVGVDRVFLSLPEAGTLSAGAGAATNSTRSTVSVHDRVQSAHSASPDVEALFAELALAEEPPRPQAADESRTTMQSFLRPDLFTTLNLAFGAPVSLSVPPGEAEQIIEIQHVSDPGRHAFPASIIEVQPGANVTIIERYSQTADQTSRHPAHEPNTGYVHAGHTLLVAQEGASVRFLQVREHAAEDLPFHHARFLIQRDASVHASVLHRGGSTGKSFFQASLLEQGARFRGTGIYTGQGSQTQHMEMGVQHLADHGESSLLYKTVLSERAHSVFLGNLEVPQGVRKVQSYQLNHNLILSREARAESRPWLVIRAEDVSCEHGATVGDLDADALFFLKSRGLPETEARRLLIQGFFEQVIGEWPLGEEQRDSVRATLMQAIS